jgi:hypothetical protein
VAEAVEEAAAEEAPAAEAAPAEEAPAAEAAPAEEHLPQRQLKSRRASNYVAGDPPAPCESNCRQS